MFYKEIIDMRSLLRAVALFLLFSVISVPPLRAESAPEVIKLTQTACQFVETERETLKNPPGDYDGCEELNKKTAGKRQFIPLKLAPGDYIFRVANRDVPYALGFWLRGTGIKWAFLPSVSGGGIEMGKSNDYKITLKKGKYLYSCPLNPTPNYPLIVE